MKPWRATWAAVATLLAAVAASSALTPSAVGQSVRTSPARAVESQPAHVKYPAAPPGARITDLGWFAPPIAPTKTRPAEVKFAYIIPIHEEITPKTFDAIKRKLRSRPSGVNMIIFDIDTPGGRIYVMEKITELFLQDLSDVYTVAYVNPDAFSAGAIIAMACNEIVMSPLGRIGAATPIMGGSAEDMGPDVRAKMHSAVQKIASTVADQNGYSPLLAKAMVSKEIDIWLIRNRRTMELQIVSPTDFPDKIANLPPAMQTATAPAVAADSTPWDFIRVIDGPNTILTMDSSEAYSVGLSSGKFKSLDDLKTAYHVESSVYIGDNWSEVLVDFLTSAEITGVLIFLLVIGVYALTHTGSHTSMILVAVSLALLLGARYLTGLALWWEILVLLAGLVLIIIEVFVIPGFGFTGILGIILVLAGLFLTLVPNLPGEAPLPKDRLGWSTLTDALLALCVAFVAATIAGYYLVRNLPRLPWARRLTLKPAVALNGPPVVEIDLYESIMPGSVGHAETVLRPVGKVRIGRDLFDAIAEGEMITAGASIRVLRREGNTLVVETTRDLE